MYLLDIYEAGHRIDTRPLPAGDYTIGRHESCEICFDHDAVSRMHAKLHVASGAVSIEDLGSSNGVLLKGERVDEAGLLPGMRVGVPPFELELRSIESEELDADTVVSAQLDESTRILAPPSVTLRLVAGSAPEQTYTLKFGRTAVGRAEDCEIRLPEDFVSRRHAVFELGYDSLVVKDQGSTVGTFVDSQRVNEKELGLGDRVLIGKAVFEIESCEGVALPTAHTRTGFAADRPPMPLDTGAMQAVSDAQIASFATSSAPPSPVPQAPLEEQPTAAGMRPNSDISAFAPSEGRTSSSYPFADSATLPASAMLQADQRPTAALNFSPPSTHPGDLSPEDLPPTLTPTALQSVDDLTPLSPTAPGMPAPAAADPIAPVAAELDAETRLQAPPEPAARPEPADSPLAMPASLIDGDAIVSSLSAPSNNDLGALPAAGSLDAPSDSGRSSTLLFAGVAAAVLLLVAAGVGSWYAWTQLSSDTAAVAVAQESPDPPSPVPADPPKTPQAASPDPKVRNAEDPAAAPAVDDDGAQANDPEARPKEPAVASPQAAEQADPRSPEAPGPQPDDADDASTAAPSSPDSATSKRPAHPPKRRSVAPKKIVRSARSHRPSKKKQPISKSSSTPPALAQPLPPPAGSPAPAETSDQDTGSRATAVQVEQFHDDGLIAWQLGHIEQACDRWRRALELSSAGHPLRQELQRKIADNCASSP